MTIHPTVVIAPGMEALFRSLADPSRLAIIACLSHGEHRVTDLMNEVKLAQSTVSEHVACLRDCGLVTGRPQGRQVFYSLTCPEVLPLLESAQLVLQATDYAVNQCPRFGHSQTETQ